MTEYIKKALAVAILIAGQSAVIYGAYQIGRWQFHNEILETPCPCMQADAARLK